MATLPDNNLRVNQKTEQTTAVVHEQLMLWSDVVPTPYTDEHPLQAGPTEGLNLRLGGDVIQALDNGAVAPVQLNPYGGGVLAADLRGKQVRLDGDANATFVSTDWIAQNASIPSIDLTFVAPPSGVVHLSYGAKLSTSLAGAKVQVAPQIFRTDVNGNEVMGPVAARALECGTLQVVTNHWQLEVDTLTPGEVYYVRLVQKMSEPATGTIWGRTLAVIPRP